MTEYFEVLDSPRTPWKLLHSLFIMGYEYAARRIGVVTSGASCRLDSWCSYQMCAFGNYADWLWLSLV